MSVVFIILINVLVVLGISVAFVVPIWSSILILLILELLVAAIGYMITDTKREKTVVKRITLGLVIALCIFLLLDAISRYLI